MSVTQSNRSDASENQTTKELRAIRAELAALRKLFDHFAGVLLNAKFPYGKPVDRWGRR